MAASTLLARPQAKDRTHPAKSSVSAASARAARLKQLQARRQRHAQRVQARRVERLAPVTQAPDRSRERPPVKAKVSAAVARSSVERSTTSARRTPPAELPVGLLFCLGTVIVLWAYQWRATTGFRAEEGLGYVFGLASVGCICALLLYPLRKRIRWLQALGPVATWFQLHMCLGVMAATLAVLHSNFALGSSNSRFAFGAVLLVAGSGLVGRFLYRKARINLSSHRAEIKALRHRLKSSRPKTSSRLAFLPLLQERLDRFDAKTLAVGRDAWESMRARMSLHRRIAREHGALMRFAARQIRREARANRTLQRHQLHLHHALEAYLNAHLLQVEKLARLLFWERLFRLWHLVHLPVFALLVVSVTLHVAVVHLY